MDAIVYRYKLSASQLPGKVREGLLVSLKFPSGEETWGEIAPLPGFSKETLEDAFLQLKAVLPLVKQNKPLPENLFPSVSFGLECAIQRPMGSSVPLSGFLTGTAEQMLEKGKLLIHQGYRSAKIKLALLPLEEALHVFDTLKDSLRLRIDLNRKWSRAKTEDFFSHFPADSFDYIEEPVDRFEDLLTLPFPLALDESLHDIPLEILSKIKNLKALVIKPTFHGGFSKWAKWVEFANQNHLDIVLSAVYESGIATLQIASLINKHNLKPLPLGIDTYRYIEQDLLETPLDFSCGELVLPPSLRIKKECLEIVHHA